MGSDKLYWKEVKDATPADLKLAEELEREEAKQGIAHPPQESPKKEKN